MKIKKQVLFFCILLFGCSSLYADSPSFSCRSVSTTVERAICNNRLLSALDNQMSKAYKNVKVNVSYSRMENVKNEQIQWIKERDSCSYDYHGADDMHECIKIMYRKKYNELKRISPLETSYSRDWYVKGNTEYRAGYYYQSLKYYHKALDYSDNDVDKIRALGALAQVSKEKGDFTLSKAYADKILEIDNSSQFAKKISQYQKPVHTYASSSYSSSSSNSNAGDRSLLCLALTWGPDVCSHQFNKFASKELGGEVTDIINSPVCAASIAKAMGETLTDGDIEVAMLTGMLDDIGKAGVDSENFFANIFGVVSYLYSFSVKTVVYDSCMAK